MSSIHGALTLVDRRVDFKVKCIDFSKTKTLTLNKKYNVSEIGLNGFFKIKGDTNRYVWHNPNRFIKKN